MHERREKAIVRTAHLAIAEKKGIHTINRQFQTALNTMHQTLETPGDSNFWVEADDRSNTLVPSADVHFEIDAEEVRSWQSIIFELKCRSKLEESVTGFESNGWDLKEKRTSQTRVL